MRPLETARIAYHGEPGLEYAFPLLLLVDEGQDERRWEAPGRIHERVVGLIPAKEAAAGPDGGEVFAVVTVRARSYHEDSQRHAQKEGLLHGHFKVVLNHQRDAERVIRATSRRNPHEIILTIDAAVVGRTGILFSISKSRADHG